MVFAVRSLPRNRAHAYLGRWIRSMEGKGRRVRNFHRFFFFLPLELTAQRRGGLDCSALCGVMDATAHQLFWSRGQCFFGMFSWPMLASPPLQHGSRTTRL